MEIIISHCGAARRCQKFFEILSCSIVFTHHFKIIPDNLKSYFVPIQDSVFVQKELKRRTKS